MESTSSTLRQLQVLCNEVLDKLEELQTKGVITPEEYAQHAKLKKKFLEDFKKHSEKKNYLKQVI